MKRLYKTTAIIWTNYNPVGVDIEDLARDTTNGDGFLKSQSYDIIE